ncbi:hypothetical protein H4S01_003524 [Coemansia sp. RSA 2610]|nr:hypothetical protein H4S01_003524 [Coemansia sp. RSA 2610]
MSNSLLQNRAAWAAVAAVGVALAASAGVYFTSAYLRANHEKVQRLRNAKRKYRELLADLAECKGVLNYFDKELAPRAQALASASDDTADGKPDLETRKRELLAIGEQVLRLMEKIDGIAPALVVEAAGLEPWSEHDRELTQKAVRAGLEQVFDLAGDVRAIRKSLIQKAERRAKRVDALKASLNAEACEPSL